MSCLVRMCVLMIVLSCGLVSTISAQEEDLNVFSRWLEWSHGKTMFMRQLNTEAFECLDKRERTIAGLHTQADWERRRAFVRETLNDIVGPFPEKTSLNARTVKVIQRDGYRIETVIFESMPQFYVTGGVFIPDGITDRRPAILYVPGHTMPCWRGRGYQNVCVNLVKKGFVVLGLDCIGQGERMQYPDPETGKSRIGGPTTEHSYLGNQCFLSGSSAAMWFTWDGIRAIDYLVSRPDVDPARIGVTGRSGGGTQSCYIMAMDDRVTVAAPECYITNFRRLLEAIGPQDGEQCFYHGLVRGIDHADLILAHAPKPTLHVTTTRDFFSIQGARETEHEVSRAYAAMGAPEHYRKVEDDLEHGITQKNNEAKFAFFQKFLNLPGSPDQLEVSLMPEDQLQITETGQVVTSLDSRTVFDLNRELTAPLLSRLDEARKMPDTYLPAALAEARRLSGFRKPAHKEAAPVYRGRYQRDGYTVERWALHSEGEMIVPLLLFVPETSDPVPAAIYLHPEGKAADAAPGGPIELLVRNGVIIAAPDLPGTGETTHEFQSGHAAVQPFYLAQMTGRSVVGIHAGDVVRVLNFLKARQEVQADNIGVVGIDDLAPAALHAAAFEPQIAALIMTGAPASYASIVNTRYYKYHTHGFIAGALTAYDLPDLLATLVPRKVAVAGFCNALKEPATPELMQQASQLMRTVYKAQEAADNLLIAGNNTPVSLLVEWALQQ